MGGLEREERGRPHHERAEDFIVDVKVVMREPAALVCEDAVICILGRVLRHDDAKSGSLLLKTK